jgi:hypothetical protein
VVSNDVVDDVGDQDTDCDHELVGCDDRTTDLARATLRLEHGYTYGQDSDTETSDDSTHHEVDPAEHGRDLDDVANDEDADTKAQALAATPPISSIRAEERTDEGSERHGRNDEGLDRGVPGNGSIGLLLAKAVDKISKDQHGRDLTLLSLGFDTISMPYHVCHTVSYPNRKPPMDVIHPKIMASMPTSAPRTLIALSMLRSDLI